MRHRREEQRDKLKGSKSWEVLWRNSKECHKKRNLGVLKPGGQASKQRNTKWMKVEKRVGERQEEKKT